MHAHICMCIHHIDAMPGTHDQKRVLDPLELWVLEAQLCFSVRRASAQSH